MHVTNNHQVFTIQEVIKLTPPTALCVEIGAFEGLSSWFIATDSRVLFAVDPWHWDSPHYGCPKDPTGDDMRRAGGGSVYFKRFCFNVGDKLFRQIFPLRAYSTEAAAIFPFKIDFIFVDGEHTYKAVQADLHAWKRTFHPDTLICFDDYGEWFDEGGLKRAVDEFCGVENLKSFHPEGTICHVFYKDTKYYKENEKKNE